MKNKNKKALRHINPYKFNAKELVFVISFCFIVVTAMSYGMTYLEKVITTDEAVALSGEHYMTFSEYNKTHYLGEFGKIYVQETVGDDLALLN